MYFNSIDFAFVNEYIHKCQYGEKGLGKNEQGIIEPIPNEGQHQRITNVGFDDFTPSSSSLLQRFNMWTLVINDAPDTSMMSGSIVG